MEGRERGGGDSVVGVSKKKKKKTFCVSRVEISPCPTSIFITIRQGKWAGGVAGA